jgi:hypothetical protein
MEKRNKLVFAFVIPFVVFMSLIIICFLWSFYRSEYYFILSESFAIPYRTPFIDTESVQLAMGCWTRGIYVYAANSCDVFPNTHFNYSPLLLRLPSIFSDTKFIMPFGISLIIGFGISLAWLPLPKRRWQIAILLLAVLSSDTVFALERANFDVMIFLLTFWGAIWAARGKSTRTMGYSMFFVATLLKFYPLSLFLLALREPPRVLVRLGAAFGVLLGVFVWVFHDEIGRSLAHLPKLHVFTNLFGSNQLGLGLSTLVDALSGTDTTAVAPPLIRLLCGALCATVALVHGRRPDQRQALVALPARTGALLVAGAAIISGCFFAADNIGYRGILMLLVLPGLLALSENPALHHRFTRTVAAALLVMWGISLQYAIMQASPARGAGLAPFAWLLQQAAWWWLVSQLLSLLVSFAIDSPSGRWLADKPLAAKGGQSSAPAGAENRCHGPNSAPRQPALVD